MSAGNEFCRTPRGSLPVAIFSSLLLATCTHTPPRPNDYCIFEHYSPPFAEDDDRPGISDRNKVIEAFNFFDNYRPARQEFFNIECVQLHAFFDETWYRSDVLYARIEVLEKGVTLFSADIPLYQDGDCEDFYRRLTSKQLGLTDEPLLSSAYSEALAAVRRRANR